MLTGYTKLVLQLTGFIRRLHPNHRRIAKGMLAVAVFVVAAKLIAMLKEMAVAWRYGTGTEVDAYLLALTIVTWLPVTVWSVATMVLVPRLVAVGNDAHDETRFLAEIHGSALVVGLVLSVAVAALAPLLVGWMAAGLPVETRTLAISFTRQMSLLSLLTVLAGTFSLRLQARQQHSYTFLEGMPALVILTLILVAPADWRGGPLLWGTLAGALIQVTLLLWLIRSHDPPVGGIALRHTSSNWQGLYQGAAIMAFGQFVLSLTAPIDQYYAASLGGGAIAVLGYANRLIALIAGLGAVTIGRALLPVLSAAIARGDLALARYQASKWAWLMMGVGGLATVIGWLLSPWVVAILFERGAFTAQDTAIVSQLLRWLLLQLPFYFAGMALMQYLSSRSIYYPNMVAAILAIIAKLVLNNMLVGPYGVIGIAISTSVWFAVWWMVLHYFMVITDVEKRN